MRIALIPTGRMELHGLERCLGRLFPDHEFVVVEAERDPYDRPIPFNGFTSSSLPTPLRGPDHMRYARSLLADLADKLDTWPSTVARIGEEAPLTSIRHAPKDRVLRNM